MIAGLLERIAPHWPAEDIIADGPDTRSFLQRLHAADQWRGENSTTLLSTFSDEAKPSWEITGCLQWTHWGIGVDLESELPAPWYDGHVWLTIGLGPYAINIARTRPRR